jgi:hypothetical protein
MKANELVVGKTYMVKTEKIEKKRKDDGFRPMVLKEVTDGAENSYGSDYIFCKPGEESLTGSQNEFWLLRRELSKKVREPKQNVTINLFCTKALKLEADRLKADGTFTAHVREHIKKFGESPTSTYGVRYHGAGTTITVWNA